MAPSNYPPLKTFFQNVPITPAFGLFVFLAVDLEKTIIRRFIR